MKNKLTDLNNYLFEELERSNDDENISEIENFEKEIKRSKAITDVASHIISNANTLLEASKLAAEYSGNANISTIMLENKNDEIHKRTKTISN